MSVPCRFENRRRDVMPTVLIHQRESHESSTRMCAAFDTRAQLESGCILVARAVLATQLSSRRSRASRDEEANESMNAKREPVPKLGKSLDADINVRDKRTRDIFDLNYPNGIYLGRGGGAGAEAGAGRRTTVRRHALAPKNSFSHVFAVPIRSNSETYTLKLAASSIDHRGDERVELSRDGKSTGSQVSLHIDRERSSGTIPLTETLAFLLTLLFNPLFDSKENQFTSRL